jgi:hypothetical protein
MASQNLTDLPAPTRDDDAHRYLVNLALAAAQRNLTDRISGTLKGIGGSQPRF